MIIEKYSAETDIDNYLSAYVRPEEFIIKCQDCPNFNRLWSCPPYCFDVRKLWKAYDKIKVFAYQIISEKDEEKIRRDLAEAKKQLGEELEAEVKRYQGSVSLAAGCCELCQTCSRADGKPCRYPEKMRYSIESLGGDVSKTLKDFFGIELLWLSKEKLPAYMVLAGGLLIKADSELPSG
jgi:predicted metal-binding protein